MTSTFVVFTVEMQILKPRSEIVSAFALLDFGQRHSLGSTLEELSVLVH